MRRLERLSADEVLDVTEGHAQERARRGVRPAERGHRMTVDDLRIAAGAVAHRRPGVTRDDDVEPLDGARGLVVVKVS